MIVDKLQKTEISFSGATLLSIEETMLLTPDERKFGRYYWLRDFCNENPKYAFATDGFDNTGFHGAFIMHNYAIRPALIISNIEETDWKIDDYFIFRDRHFRIISNTLAFLLDNIDGTYSFDANTNIYSKSHIKTLVDQWYRNLTNYTGYNDSEGNSIYVGDTIKEGCNGLISTVEWNAERASFWLKGLGEGYGIENAHIDWTKIK